MGLVAHKALRGGWGRRRGGTSAAGRHSVSVGRPEPQCPMPSTQTQSQRRTPSDRIHPRRPTGAPNVPAHPAHLVALAQVLERLVGVRGGVGVGVQPARLLRAVVAHARHAAAVAGPALADGLRRGRARHGWEGARMGVGGGWRWLGASTGRAGADQRRQAGPRSNQRSRWRRRAGPGCRPSGPTPRPQPDCGRGSRTCERRTGGPSCCSSGREACKGVSGGAVPAASGGGGC